MAVCSNLLARNLNDYIIKSDTTFTLIISILLKGQISKCYAKYIMYVGQLMGGSIKGQGKQVSH